ncbi:MAG: outer membrane protein assembly factor BamB family protein, partial [Planctomycetota bacterium]
MSIRLAVVFFHLVLTTGSISSSAIAAEDWLQYKFDGRHSGNAADRTVQTPLKLQAAIPLSDGIYASPVIADGRIYAVDGSGVAICIDAHSFEVLWKTPTRGGLDNVNNVSSPAIAGSYLHFGTMAGFYCVLDRETGRIVREIDCRDPIFSAPVVGNDRVYFATLGSQVFCVEPDGSVVWSWDFVKEVIGFDGDRWSGEQWHKHKQGRVTWRDHFCCSRNLAMYDSTVVIPAGGRVVFLEDGGDIPRLRNVAEIPRFHGGEYPAAFGLSIGEDNSVYVQWHRRDNAGRTDILKLNGDDVKTDIVPGTQTYIDTPGLMSFASVSLRGTDVYRVRPEQGFGLCRHVPSPDTHADATIDRSEEAKYAQYLGGYPSICSPILLQDQAVYGGLDGTLYVVPLSGDGEAWSFKTPFDRPITAPAAVFDGRICFGGEDGYLYILGPD